MKWNSSNSNIKNKRKWRRSQFIQTIESFILHLFNPLIPYKKSKNKNKNPIIIIIAFLLSFNSKGNLSSITTKCFPLWYRFSIRIPFFQYFQYLMPWFYNGNFWFDMEHRSNPPKISVKERCPKSKLKFNWLPN